MEEFKNDITLYIKCDNLIRDFNERSTAMREQRESYSNRIMSYMSQHDLEDTKLDLKRYKSTIRMSTHTNQETMSYQFLQKTFTEYFGDKNQAENLIRYLKQSRTKEQKKVLVRNIIKK